MCAGAEVVSSLSLGDMSSIWSKLFLCALVGLSAAQYSSSSPSTSSRPCNVTQIEGCNATDTMKNMDGSQ